MNYISEWWEKEVQDIKFSVIVPVYNTSEYLVKCFDSIINQTYRNLEIILVNDGSTDSSPAICEEYASKDSRIAVIHKANGGLSEARNDGLRVATGDYIVYVDSDDYIDVRSCEAFYDTIFAHHDIEVIVSNIVSLNKNKKFFRNTIQSSPISGKDFLKFQLKAGTFNVGAFFFICKRAFLIENGLYFPKGRLAEDVPIAVQICLIAQRIMAIDFVHYYYLVREDSITQTKDRTKLAEDYTYNLLQIEKMACSVEDRELRMILTNWVIKRYLRALIHGKCYKKSKSYIINLDLFKNKNCSAKLKIVNRIFRLSPRFCVFVLYLLFPFLTKMLYILKPKSYTS
jgi:glycosyltransferase involved in cell wall biosynthesis